MKQEKGGGFLNKRQAEALAAFVASGAFELVTQQLEGDENERMIAAARAADWKEQKAAGCQVIAIRDFRQVIELMVKAPTLPMGADNGAA